MFKGETFVFHPQNMCFYPGPFFPPSILCSKVYIGGVFLRPTLPGTSSWANAVGGKRPRRLGFSHVRLQTCGASPTSMILLESVSTCISLYIYICILHMGRSDQRNGSVISTSLVFAATSCARLQNSRKGTKMPKNRT